MLINHSDVSKLNGNPWCAVEIRSEGTVEIILHRLLEVIPALFRDHPFQLVIPVLKRDLLTFELCGGPYLYVRSTDLKALLRLRHTTGIIRLMTTDESDSVRKIIWVQDEYVRNVLQKCQEFHEARTALVQVGKFVRIIDSPAKGLCGTVETIHEGQATVRINLRSKGLTVKSPVANLLALDVPEHLQVPFYSPLVKGLEEPSILRYYQQGPPPAKPLTPEQEEEMPPPKMREKQVSHLIRTLIADGELNANKIGETIIASIKADKLSRVPKNLQIIFCFIKQEIIKAHPTCQSYRFLKSQFPEHYMAIDTFTAMAEAAGVRLAKDQHSEGYVKWVKKEKPPAQYRELKIDWKDPVARSEYNRQMYLKRKSEGYVKKEKPPAQYRIDWKDPVARSEYNRQRYLQRKKAL